jgi:tRNA threonylcarbamoyl adenosine modification protein YeaZ
MILLSLDCSSPVVSVALVAEDRVLFRENTPHARSDSAPLFRSLEAAIASHGRPDGLCVGLGPGSYNGIRASIAAARAMATALEIPLYAIPSPLGVPGPGTGFLMAGDARGGHSWLARVENGQLSGAPLLVPKEDLPELLAKDPDLPCLTASPMEGISSETATPDAALLAHAALRSDPFYRCHGTPEPLYLKPPHITTPRTNPTRA